MVGDVVIPQLGRTPEEYSQPSEKRAGQSRRSCRHYPSSSVSDKKGSQRRFASRGGFSRWSAPRSGFTANRGGAELITTVDSFHAIDRSVAAEANVAAALPKGGVSPNPSQDLTWWFDGAVNTANVDWRPVTPVDQAQHCRFSGGNNYRMSCTARALCGMEYGVHS